MLLSLAITLENGNSNGTLNLLAVEIPTTLI
mgnify:CR=1 FL=1